MRSVAPLYNASARVLLMIRSGWAGQTLGARYICSAVDITLRRWHDVCSVLCALGWGRKANKQFEFFTNQDVYGFQSVSYTMRNRVGAEAAMLMRWLTWNGAATCKDIHGPTTARHQHDTFYYARSVLAGLGMVRADGKVVRAVGFALM